jgi:hypothetical protein
VVIVAVVAVVVVELAVADAVVDPATAATSDGASAALSCVRLGAGASC